MKGPACTDSLTSVREEARRSWPVFSSLWYSSCGRSRAAPRVPRPPAEPRPVPGVPSPGAPGIGDPYYPLLGNGGYDAIHYTIDLDLDVEAGSILEATTTIDAVATQDLSAFNLDFRGPEIDAIAVNGVPADWTRDGGELTITPAASAARRGAISDGQCATTGRRRSTKRTASSAAGGRPTTRSSRSGSRRVLTSGTRSMATRWTRRPTRWRSPCRSRTTWSPTGASTPWRGRPGPRATPRRQPSPGKTRSRRRAIS